MTIDDAIALINHPALRGHLAKPAPGNQSPAPAHWADLGCGSGLFTLALAKFLQPGSIIDAFDLHPAIARQTTNSGVAIRPRTADFTRDHQGFPDVDGILMANSLHYVRDKTGFLTRIKNVQAFLLVEYDTDRAVPSWVPYPLSFRSASELLPAVGWSHVEKLGSHPSSFGQANLYATLALR